MNSIEGQISIPDIFAAGDCCEDYDLSIYKSRVLALLPNAYKEEEFTPLLSVKRLLSIPWISIY